MNEPDRSEPDERSLAVPAVVVGAGPAGISTALWLRRLRVPSRLLDRAPAIGGELLRVNLAIEDYPGLRAADGRELAGRLEAQLRGAGVEPELGVEVTALDVARRRLGTTAGEVPYAALVVATGLARRRLGVPGEREYLGRGVTYSATTDLAVIAGRTAIVVGGGDGAFDNAAILAGVCPRVTIVVRSGEPRARPELVRTCVEAPNVTVLTMARPLAVEGDRRRVTGLRVQRPSGVEVVEAEWIVVKVGFEPVTGFLGGQIELDGAGHVRVDRRMATSAPGIFAAGDVANPWAPSIAAAVGDGAMAARGVFEHLRGTGGAG